MKKTTIITLGVIRLWCYLTCRLLSANHHQEKLAKKRENE